MLRKIDSILSYQNPYRFGLYNKLKKFYISKASKKPHEDLLKRDMVDRPWYGHCIYEAAKLAKLLGIDRISVIEFGVAGGNGLLNVEYHIREIKKEFDMNFEVYGFDLKGGLPDHRSYKDCPHIYSRGFYKMDNEKELLKRLKYSHLVIGDVSETVPTFFETYNPAPIGCVLFDLDYYTSTNDALQIFNCEHENYLPRVECYFDDVLMINKYLGVLASIEEYNNQNELKKIAKPNLFEFTRIRPQYWNHKIYTHHIFDHIQYAVNPREDHQLPLDKPTTVAKFKVL